MRSVNNKHNEFAESLRNIMRTEEKKQSETQRKSDEEYDEEYDEETQSLQELWRKIEELFAPIDDNDD